MFHKQLTFVLLLTLAGKVALAQHNPPNGDFQSATELEHWTADGDVQEVENTTTGNKFVLMQEGAMAGSRSSIHRLEDIPANPTWLWFRYRFLTSSLPRTSTVPPDSTRHTGWSLSVPIARVRERRTHHCLAGQVLPAAPPLGANRQYLPGVPAIGLYPVCQQAVVKRVLLT